MKNFSINATALVLLGVLIGSGGAYALMNRDKDALTSSGSMSGMDHGSMSSMNMDSMNAQLKDKTGNDFDTFLSLMTEHHQGAIDMAMQAKQNAKHAELKAMADDIIFVQNHEIEQMKAWKQQWGY